MRRPLRTALLGLVLTTALGACGSDAGGGHDRRAAALGGPPASSVTLVSGTAGDGQVSPRATPLPDDIALASYVGQFSDGLAGKVTRTAGQLEVSDGEVLVAAVIAIGCDVPPGAQVRGAGEHVVIVPEKVAAPLRECLAPVTTVGLAVVAA